MATWRTGGARGAKQKTGKAWVNQAKRMRTAKLAALAQLFGHENAIEPPSATIADNPPCGEGDAPKGKRGRKKGWRKTFTPEEQAARDALAAKKAKKQANKIHTEAYHQARVVVTCGKLKLPFYAVPNAARRTMWEIVQAKRAGIKAGVPDMVFPVARNGYHHLYLEMKRPDKAKAVVSPTQKAWHELLRENGSKVEIAYGYDEAIAVICDYFGISMEACYTDG